MSWILGYVGMSLSPARRERLAALEADPLFQSAGERHYVACGGIPETCFHGTFSGDPNPTATSGGFRPGAHGSVDHGATARRTRSEWAVVGTGVHVDNASARILSASDWQTLLGAPLPQLRGLGGGFVAVRWSEAGLEAFSDVFGLRSLYWAPTEGGFYFSTRVERLCALVGGLSIDWKVFDSHWLAYHQLSSRSLIEGLERLGPSGYVRLSGTEAEKRSVPYTPQATERPIGRLLRTLLEPNDGNSVSLGLSGGMDSRLLLAVGRNVPDFGVHVFGPKSRRDVQVALRIGENEALPHRHLDLSPPPADALPVLIRSHAVDSQAVSPASAAVSLRYYPELRRAKRVVVDGGFGEILRRQFMNRLLRKGERAVNGQDAVAAVDLVRFTRASVFTRACEREMIFGARRDMAMQLDALSYLRDFDLPDRIDILNIRTRLPNFFGYEQARLDGVVQSYMPFAHPALVDAVLALPSAYRANGKAARGLIAAHAPGLRKYPLVKGDVTYPYRLPPVAAAGYVKARKRLARQTASSERDVVLDMLKEFILDRIGSASVRGFTGYEPASLDRLAEGYYRHGTGGAQLDWWLAFDLWREGMTGAE